MRSLYLENQRNIVDLGLHVTSLIILQNFSHLRPVMPESHKNGNSFHSSGSQKNEEMYPNTDGASKVSINDS